MQLLINNQVQFVCSWCYVQPHFIVQIYNFFCLILFSALIHKKRGKKLIRKITKRNLDSSSKMYTLSVFILKSFKLFLENYQFCRKSGNDANSRGRGVMFFTSLSRNAYENRYVIHPYTIQET